MGFTAAVIAVVTAEELLSLGVKDEVTEEVAREADCEDDVINVCPVPVGIEFEELVDAAVIVLSNVDVPLPLSIVLLLAAHCPAYRQSCPVAQQIDPHNICPNPPSQIHDVAAAAAVLEVCVVTEFAGAKTGVEEDD